MAISGALSRITLAANEEADDFSTRLMLKYGYNHLKARATPCSILSVRRLGGDKLTLKRFTDLLQPARNISARLMAELAVGAKDTKPIDMLNSFNPEHQLLMESDLGVDGFAGDLCS